MKIKLSIYDKKYFIFCRWWFDNDPWFVRPDVCKIIEPLLKTNIVWWVFFHFDNSNPSHEVKIGEICELSMVTFSRGVVTPLLYEYPLYCLPPFLNFVPHLETSRCHLQNVMHFYKRIAKMSCIHITKELSRHFSLFNYKPFVAFSYVACHLENTGAGVFWLYHRT